MVCFNVNHVELSVLFQENLDLLRLNLLLSFANGVKSLIRLLLLSLLLLKDDIDADSEGQAALCDVSLEESSFATLHECSLFHLDLSYFLFVDLVAELTSFQG